MPPPDLEQLQRRFWRFITAPTGVTDALPVIAADDPDAAPLSRWLDASDDQVAATRLDVYANMYFFRLRDILAEDFAQVHRVVGADTFHDLVTDFLLAHPPADPNLRNLGVPFPAFCATHALADRWPFLADLAAFEWARLSVFDLADEAPLTASDLQAVPPAAWGGLALRTIAAATLVEAAWPVDRLWAASRAGDPLDVAAGATTLLVWRRGFRIYHRQLVDPERGAVSSLLDGACFADVCAHFAGPDDDAMTGAAQAALAAVRRWLDEGLLATTTNLETASRHESEGASGSDDDRATTKET